MKTLKTSLIATIVTIIIIALCATACGASAEADTYTVKAVVMGEWVAFADVWEVTARTADGEEYGWFADAEDNWQIGDLVLLTMWKCGREEDDEVMDVVRVDTLTPVEVAHWFER